MESNNICPICLRTNRQLKVIPNALSEYHDELTSYSLPLKNHRYCSECEWLLRKIYNFQQKCVAAANILKKWNVATKEKIPADQLHQELPPISLGYWTSNNTKVFKYICADKLKKSLLIKKNEMDEPETDIVVEHDIVIEQDKSEKLIGRRKRSVVKDECVEHKIHSKKISKTELEHEPCENIGISDTSFRNFNNNGKICINSSEEATRVFKSDIKSNDIANNASSTSKARKPCIELGINVKNEIKHTYNTRSNMAKLTKETKNENIFNNIGDKDSEQIRLSEKDDKKYNDVIEIEYDDKYPDDASLNSDDGSDDYLYSPPKDVGLINEMCVKTEDYGGLCDLKGRLKAELARWDELRTRDGVSFDKNIILDRLHILSDRMTQQLLNLLCGETWLQRGALTLLKKIQDKQILTQYESVFDIEYLTTEKDKLEEFDRRKTYECYVKAAFKCETCYQGFKSQKFLEYHKKTKHDESRSQFTCNICHVTNYTKNNIYTHRISHSVVYKCKLCPLVTYYSESMINHYEQHNGTIYKCEKCGKTFKSKSVLMSHMGCAHRGDHACSSCGNAFNSRAGLRHHAAVKHRDEPTLPADAFSFGCEKCSLKFLSQEACARHQKITHGIRRRRNPESSQKVINKPNMTCPECKAVGHSYGWMVDHFKFEHPTLDVKDIYAPKKSYLCEICGKGFRNTTVLREHAQAHAGVTFPCATCGKRFVSRHALRGHEEWHGAPRHCCQTCGKKFHAASNLSNHMRMHVGDRRFKCPICDKGFLHRASMTTHLRGVHGHQRRERKGGVAGTRADDTGEVDTEEVADVTYEVLEIDMEDIGAEEII